LHRWIALRKKNMQIQDYKIFDMFVNLNETKKKNIEYEEAKK